MILKDLFISRSIYWALAAGVVIVLTVIGINELHVRDFVLFQFLILGVSILVVAVITLTYRPGERITREPLDLKDDN